jgi:uncharacterized protein (TIGR02588 family)
MTVTNKRSRTNTEQREASWVEWTTGIVSLLLVLALLGWIGREALVKDSSAPELKIEITGMSRSGEFHRVEFELVNDAPSTAAAVKVVGELRGSNGEVEISDVTFDYAPAESRTRGGILFRGDPQAGTLSIRPAGYTEP